MAAASSDGAPLVWGPTGEKSYSESEAARPEKLMGARMVRYTCALTRNESEQWNRPASSRWWSTLWGRCPDCSYVDDSDVYCHLHILLQQPTDWTIVRCTTLSDTGLQCRKTVNTASVNYEQTAINQINQPYFQCGLTNKQPLQGPQRGRNE